jgi:hypothetical protein
LRFETLLCSCRSSTTMDPTDVASPLHHELTQCIDAELPKALLEGRLIVLLGLHRLRSVAGGDGDCAFNLASRLSITDDAAGNSLLSLVLITIESAQTLSAMLHFFLIGHLAGVQVRGCHTLTLFSLISVLFVSRFTTRRSWLNSMRLPSMLFPACRLLSGWMPSPCVGVSSRKWLSVPGSCKCVATAIRSRSPHLACPCARSAITARVAFTKKTGMCCSQCPSACQRASCCLPVL